MPVFRAEDKTGVKRETHKDLPGQPSSGKNFNIILIINCTFLFDFIEDEILKYASNIYYSVTL